MLFAVSCKDKPGSFELRMKTREKHLGFIRGLGGQVQMAGPFLSEDGSEMVGSLLILEADDRTAAEAIAAQDPYAQAGLFESVEIVPWKLAFNNM